MKQHIVAAMLLLSATASARAQRELKDIPDPDPAKQLAALKVADGFEINLFASDPMIAKPIQMNWDTAGRLWLATSSTYPHIVPGQKADDKVVVLEDTNGDGRADKHTVFAGGLLIPTGVAPSPAGAYIANSTELMFLKDTDGDGVADSSEVVLSGFGTEDTHHILHTFRWGPDGMLYFNQSIYIHSHIETPWGPRELGGGGIWQFRPENMKLEVFARGFVNAWGHEFDYWGQSFATDGAYGEGINYVFPGATFVTAPGAKRILAGLNPGQPKHCGLAILSGRHLPPEFTGTCVANDFRGNRVNRFVVTDADSGYSSRQAPDLVTTSHIAFRPIDVKVGPDGAIYIADWYNPIIQHGEVDFRDPRRDHVHGRIWRLTAKGRPLVKPPKLVGASIDELLDCLKLPEEWARIGAKLELKQRGREAVLDPLAVWLTKLDKTNAQLEHDRLEGLWVYQSLDVVQPELLKEVLRSPEPRARSAAVRVLGQWFDRVSDARELLHRAIADEHPRVRLEAVNALRRLGTPQDVEAALRALDKPMDGNLDFAAWLTARELAGQWTAEYRASRLKFNDDIAHAIFALRAAEDSASLRPMVELVRTGKVPAQHLPDAYQLFADIGGPEELGLVFQLALDVPADRRVAMFQSLEQAARQRGVKPAGNLDAIVPLLTDADVATVRSACRLAGLWKLESARVVLRDLATRDGAEPATVQSAIDGLKSLGGPQSIAVFEQLSEVPAPTGIRSSAVAALASLDLRNAAKRAAILLAEGPAGLDPAPVIDAFVQQKEGPGVLAAALNGQTIPTPIAESAVRRAGSSGRDVAPLLAALKLAGGLDQVQWKLSTEQFQQLLAEIPTKGSAARGEVVYRRTNLQCQKCHGIAGAGGLVGPDLLSIGASAPVDYLVDSLLEPNKKIKEGYHTVSVATNDGQVIAGVFVRKTDKELLLRDNNGVERAIPNGEIAEQNNSPVSLMPADLMRSVGRQDFIDLVRFLSELGKDGAYKAPANRYIRRWRVLDASQELSNQLRRQSTAVVFRKDAPFQWSPAYSTVAGRLELTDLPNVRRFGDDLLAFARFELNVLAPGPARLKINDPTGVQLWLGANQLPIEQAADFNAEKGIQVFTLILDLRKRREPIQIELVDVPASPARIELTTGP